MLDIGGCGFKTKRDFLAAIFHPNPVFHHAERHCLRRLLGDRAFTYCCFLIQGRSVLALVKPSGVSPPYLAGLEHKPNPFSYTLHLMGEQACCGLFYDTGA